MHDAQYYMNTMLIEHHLQRQILEALTKAESLRFSQLKPTGLESNIFMYHLKQLMSQELVEKEGTSYRLAPKGLTYVDQLSSTNLRPRLQPKLLCILLVRSDTGKVALLKRLAQPHIGQYMLPSGKLHFGETLTAHAHRELDEKLGLRVPLKPRGMTSVLLRKQGKAITHIVAPVYEARTAEVPLHCKDKRFIPEWVSDAELDKLDLIPGTRELISEPASELYLKEFIA